MRRNDRLARLLLLGVALILVDRSAAGQATKPGAAAPAASIDAGSPEIPAALAPFEHLVGAWKGMAVPQADRLKGWPERHLWAWAFERGAPTGMTIDFEGSKSLKRVRLKYDAAGKHYTLEGDDAAGKPVAYRGTLGDRGQALILERAGVASGAARERLTIRLNSNKIRYSWLVEAKEMGAPQYAKVLDANLGKEGESFAAGGAEEDLPECVLTGGAATLTVTYGGKTFPVCCTGCRDEFLADPEKYVRKAALRAANAGEKPKAKPAARGSDDDFDAALGDAPAEKPARRGAMPKKSDAKVKAAPKPAESTGQVEEKPAAADPEARAGTLLRLGQSLEKAGKTAGAMDYYRRVVKGFPGTEASRTAEARIKALGKPL